MPARSAAALVALVVFGGCLAAPEPEEPAAAQADDGLTTLDLQVVDALTGGPVAKASLEIGVAGVGTVRKVTDADGAARVTVRPATTCSLLVEREGYQAGRSSVSCLNDARLRVPLKPAATGSSSSSSTTPRSSSSTSSGSSAPPSNGSSPPPNQTAGNQTQQNSTEPRPFDPEEPEGNGNCAGLTPRNTGAQPLPLFTGGWPMLELDGILVADPAFVHAHPDDWQDRLLELLDTVSTLYEAQLGLRLNATLVARLPDGTLAPEPVPAGTVLGGQSNMRSTARGFLQENHPGVPYDFVAVILGADYAAAVAGQVECVGGSADPEYAYLWAEYDGSLKGAAKVLAHELGHLLDAHHHYSTCGEAPPELDYPLGVCDIMINAVDFAGPRFGSTNRLVIRSFVESQGIGRPV